MTQDDADAAVPRVAVIGIPLDENSSFLRGSALAPVRIRAALHAGSMNLTAEDGVDLGARDDWRDLGDLSPGSGEAAFTDITERIASLYAAGSRVLTLGGDHSITFPIMRGLVVSYPALTENKAVAIASRHPFMVCG
jgi:arginase family enzyme